MFTHRFKLWPRGRQGLRFSLYDASGEWTAVEGAMAGVRTCVRVGAVDASLENGVMRRLNSIDHSLATTYTTVGALQEQVKNITTRLQSEVHRITTTVEQVGVQVGGRHMARHQRREWREHYRNR